MDRMDTGNIYPSFFYFLLMVDIPSSYSLDCNSLFCILQNYFSSYGIIYPSSKSSALQCLFWS